MNFESIIQGFGDGRTGAMPIDAVAELQKALTAGYGSDVATLTGGGALRIQSLEATMLATIQENKHFRLFNALQKSNATATVDEWTEHSGVGGFLGGSTNTETGAIAQATGAYKRRVGLVKYMMTMRQVSFVASLQNALVDAEAAEYQAGSLQLLTDAEYLSFEGDSTVVPTEFDGIEYQVANFGDPEAVIDVGAQPLDNIKPVNQGASLISRYGNFGVPTDLFTSQLVQSDLDNYLDPAFRVPLTSVPGGGIQIGSPVRGLRTSWGDIGNHADVFIRDADLKMPFSVVSGGQFAAAALALNANQQPAGVAYAVGAQAGSKFVTAQGGNYYYAVAGVSASGESEPLVGAQQAVAAGQGVTITITHSTGGAETGYAVYRSRLNGTNAPNDLRLVKRIPRNANLTATTVFIDINTDIPGTTKAYMLNMTPGAKAITWRQFLPMMKFPLYPTNSAIIPWAQLLFGFLRLGKARHHVVFKNILPASQTTWRPFG